MTELMDIETALKDRIEMLERECTAANAQIEKMEAIIFAYSQITNLTITMNEADDDNNPKYDR